MRGLAQLLELRQNLAPAAIGHGAEQTAPAAGTVCADSLALPAVQGLQAGNLVLVIADMSTTDTAANLAQLAHRNAANSADLELADGQTGVLAGGQGEACIFGIFALQNTGERFVVRNKNAGTAALFYQANVYVFPFPG
jgi:hypothetical protein